MTELKTITVKFTLEKETPGAVRFKEVDESGEVIEQAFCKIGTLYVRKTTFERGKYPKSLTVRIDFDA
jgi:hypothetical protein